MAPSSQRRGRG